MPIINCKWRFPILFLIFLNPALVAASQTPANETRLIKNPSGWQLVRGGNPYFIKGAGGSGPLPMLKQAGANSIRLWDAEKTDSILDEANKLGLTVTLGIWLGQERQGFNYNDPTQVFNQQERVKKLVLKYKDHPALLAWGLGNEMEGDGNNAAIWTALNSLAVMVKKLDPYHPVMTVIAEIGGDKVKNLHQLCPEIDIVGINSYAGAESLAKRYAVAGGTKPYVVTEFGPPGTWEVVKTAWGEPLEPTSAEKADWYRRAYTGSIDRQPLCLGSYAFTWGFKQEATTTWFGMLIPDGSRLASVDAMTECWTGKPPVNLCPVIADLKLAGSQEVDPGSILNFSATSTDPNGDPLKVTWTLRAETDIFGTGGDNEQVPPIYAEATIKSDSRSATIKMPSDPGAYRLYVQAEDGKGGAATANLPLLVKGVVKIPDGRFTKLPLLIYGESVISGAPYVPTGWMGNTKAIKVSEDCTIQPFAGNNCIRCEYGAAADWGGVVWQNPGNDWGDRPGGWNLTGAKRLVFMARGNKGGETVSFSFGLIGKEKRFFDTGQGKLENVKLTTDWKEYSIDLAGKDLTRIKTGFAWTLAAQGGHVVFYLDNIRYE